MARFLALDWDHKQLQIVAANLGKGGAKILQAVALAEEQSPNPGDAEALGTLLKERLKTAGIAPAPAYFCIGRERVILKEVRFPAVPAHEEPAIVRFQAIRDIADSPDDVVLDYALIGKTTEVGDRRALVLVVRRELLKTYETICQAAGLKLAGLVPRPFGLLACLQEVLAQGGSGEAADASVGIVALTANWAEFCVVRDNQLIFTRQLAPGGNLLGEIRRNLSVYNGQSNINPVRSLYLAGSSSHAELREKLQESLGFPVHSLDPFGGSDRQDLPAANRGAFTGAVGLLLMRAQSADMPINFVHPKQPKPPQNPNRRAYFAAAAAAAVLLLGGIYFGYSALSQREQVISNLTADKNSLDRQLTALEEDDKKIKKIGEWANTEVNWLDELYDMVDRFPSTDGTRLTMFKGEPRAQAPNAKDPHVARMELAGITSEDQHELEALFGHLTQEGYVPDSYHTQPNTNTREGRGFVKKFTDKVEVQPRAPDKYVRTLKIEETSPGRGRGGRAGGGPGRGGRGAGNFDMQPGDDQQ